MQLSQQQFTQAKSFIEARARPLDQALYYFHFEEGSRQAVLEALIQFQNEDGGFGQALEPDSRLPASSPLATTVALQIMQDVSLPASHPLFQQAVAYLSQTFHRKKGYWQPMDAAVNDFPHAPWWTYDHEQDKTLPESPINPTAEVLGYLYAGLGQDLPDFCDDVAGMIASYLAKNVQTISMEGIHCYQRALDLYPLDLQDRVKPTLGAAIQNRVEPNPEAWSGYVAKPLAFVHSPDSAWYDELRPGVEANLDYAIQSQAADGSWPPTWNWGDDFPEAWAIARREWAGLITVGTLKTLRAFNRMPSS